MIIRTVNLETVCGITSALPENTLPEVAFAGKSNVGKSSLINALMNRKSLARTSSKPGKTQTINFYNVNEKMYLVDLPGYGYATANEEIKAQWGTMIENYLHNSKQLAAVFLLMDIRREPSENDCLMYDWMVAQGFAPIIIATKLDKVSRGEAARQLVLIRKKLHASVTGNFTPTLDSILVLPFSAETKEGKDEIWETMETLAFGQPLREETGAEQELRRKREERQKIKEREAADAGETGKKKERWKKTDRPLAKKTAGKQAAKKLEERKRAGKNPKKRK